ncbi:MAG: hypothetical protein R6V14_03895 [Halanaerobiales bacterium]
MLFQKLDGWIRMCVRSYMEKKKAVKINTKESLLSTRLSYEDEISI